MKYSAHRGDYFYMLNNSNLLSKFSSPSQLFSNPQNLSSHSIYPNKSDTTPRHDKRQSGMIYGFGIQVSKIPTQLRERTPVRPLQYAQLNSRKPSLIPKIPSSAQKTRKTETDIFGKWPKEVTKLELPKLPQIKRLSNKKKGNSQPDITIPSKRSSAPRLTKLSKTSKEESREREDESFMSGPIFPSEAKKDLVEIRAREIEEYMKRGLERENTELKNNNEGKSFNIVQRRLNNNKDTLLDFWDTRPTRKERTFGIYLQKALNEVSMNNVNNGIQSAFLNVTPSSTGLEIKGQAAKERERVKDKPLLRGRREERDFTNGNISTSIISGLDREREERENKFYKEKISSRNELEKLLEFKESPKDRFKRVQTFTNRNETEENRKINVEKPFQLHKDSTFDRDSIQRSYSIDKTGKVHKIFKEGEFLSNPRPKYPHLDRSKKSAQRLPSNLIEREQGRSGRQMLDPLGNNETRKFGSNAANKSIREDYKKDKSVNKKEESPRIEEYQYDGQSDDDLSLYDYMKAKKENTEKEVFEFDFIQEK